MNWNFRKFNYFSVFRYPSMGLKLWNFLSNFDFQGKIVAKFLLRKHFLYIYDNKTTLTMGTFKKYVTWIMIFFILFTCVTLCKLYFKTSPVLLKISNYGMRKMKIFLHIGRLPHITLYIKGCRKLHRHTCLCKQPILIK